MDQSPENIENQPPPNENVTPPTQQKPSQTSKKSDDMSVDTPVKKSLLESDLVCENNHENLENLKNLENTGNPENTENPENIENSEQTPVMEIDLNSKNENNPTENEAAAPYEYLEEEPVPFVEGWLFIRTLGEGAFGVVRLAVNENKMNEKLAVKIVDLNLHPNCGSAVNKEVSVHKRLKHENIIQFYGERLDDNKRYIYLEYADGSELFDRITPDKGMDQKLAKPLFKQLMLAVQYIHKMGFTHRDIKPENILVTHDNKLKLIDFGMATVFKHRGNERLLTKPCGTAPYLAPEVLIGKPYNAEPAEIWSCGIVLITMLAGEMPWKEASTESDDFNAWIDKDPKLESRSPWTKLDVPSIVFIRKILSLKPKRRPTIPTLLNHKWLKDKNPATTTVGAEQSQKIRDISSKLNKSRIRAVAEEDFGPLNENELNNEPNRKRKKLERVPSGGKTWAAGLVTGSQKIDAVKRVELDDIDNLDDIFDSDFTNKSKIKYKIRPASQPVSVSEFLTKSQIPAGFSQFMSQKYKESYQFPTRCTKMFINLQKVATIESQSGKNRSLSEIFENICDTLGLIIVNRDSQKLVLMPTKTASMNVKPTKFKVYINDTIEVQGKDGGVKSLKLLDFRLCEGCGLDFKRHFIALEASLKKYSDKLDPFNGVN